MHHELSFDRDSARRGKFIESPSTIQDICTSFLCSEHEAYQNISKGKITHETSLGTIPIVPVMTLVILRIPPSKFEVDDIFFKTANHGQTGTPGITAFEIITVLRWFGCILFY